MSAPAVIIAALNLTPVALRAAGRRRRAAHVRRHRTDSGAADDPRAAPAADRARAAVRRHAARRRAHQSHQDRPAGVAGRDSRDVAHRRLHARGLARHRGDRRAGRGRDRRDVTAVVRRGRDDRRTEAERRGPVGHGRCAAPARLARHAARAALPHPPGRGDSARWQPGEPGGHVGDGRAGACRRRSCGRTSASGSACRPTIS